MSRGPGRWQRVLLDALEAHEAASVLAVTWRQFDPAGVPTRSDLVAVRRAAHRLRELGHVQLAWGLPDDEPNALLYVARLDADLGALGLDPWLSRDEAAERFRQDVARRDQEATLTRVMDGAA